MKKQQFMAISLPFGLYQMRASDGKIIENSIAGYISEFSKCAWINKFTPILYSLDMLTKPIEHKGERFVPIDYLWYDTIGTDNDCFSKDEFYELIESGFVKLYPFCVVQKLVEWHFNLMDESEPFIDVNTLPENPYK